MVRRGGERSRIRRESSSPANRLAKLTFFVELKKFFSNYFQNKVERGEFKVERGPESSNPRKLESSKIRIVECSRIRKFEIRNQKIKKKSKKNHA